MRVASCVTSYKPDHATFTARYCAHIILRTTPRTGKYVTGEYKSI
jgi:hypothetical protein